MAQVKFAEFTSDGAVRHGVYLGLRGDKSAKEVEAEMAAPAMKTRVRLTHPDKVLFPDPASPRPNLRPISTWPRSAWARISMAGR